MTFISFLLLFISLTLLASGRAIGFPDTPDSLPASAGADTIERTRKPLLDPKSFHKPSMMLDMEQNRPIEVEVIIGEVVRMAKARDVAIPVSSSSLLSIFVMTDRGIFSSPPAC